VRGLPRLRAPGTVPCIISFSRQTLLFPRGVTTDTGSSTPSRLAACRSVRQTSPRLSSSSSSGGGGHLCTSELDVARGRGGRGVFAVGDWQRTDPSRRPPRALSYHVSQQWKTTGRKLAESFRVVAAGRSPRLFVHVGGSHPSPRSRTFMIHVRDYSR